MKESTRKFMAINGFEETWVKTKEMVADKWRLGLETFNEVMKEDLQKVIINACESQKAALENAIADVYEMYLTEDDINAIIAYHESEVGQKLAQLGPKVYEKLNEVTVEWENATLKKHDKDLQAVLQPLGGGVAEPEPKPADPPAAA